MKTVVITQSNYIPWRGYFDMLRQADEAILLDCVQYTRRDWRNRNKIKTPDGPRWISIPVKTKGRYHQAIDETEVVDAGWAEEHIRKIENSYRRAAAYEKEAPWLFGEISAAAQSTHLSAINRSLTVALCRRIGIAQPVLTYDRVLPRDDLIGMTPSGRLLALCKARNASHYMSGPSAMDYLDLSAFRGAGIEVVWMDYSGYPDYPQVWGSFAGALSIIDLLLNVGASAAPGYLKRRCA